MPRTPFDPARIVAQTITRTPDGRQAYLNALDAPTAEQRAEWIIDLTDAAIDRTIHLLILPTVDDEQRNHLFREAQALVASGLKQRARRARREANGHH